MIPPSKLGHLLRTLIVSIQRIAYPFNSLNSSELYLPMAKAILTPRVIEMAAIVAIGSLQFGYHMAELNAPEGVLSCTLSVPGNIPYNKTFFGSHGYKKCIPLSSEQIGWVTSIFSIGGLLGSFYAGSIADKIGRKRAALVHNLILFVGSFLNAVANTFPVFLCGRFIAGVGAGSAIVITSLVINEIAPAQYKGFIGSMNQFSINIGIFLAQALALWLCTDNLWRYLLLTGSVIAAVNFAAILLYMNESPVWLYNNGHSIEAFKVLHSLRGYDYSDSRNEMNSWKFQNDRDNLEALLSENGSSSSIVVTVGVGEYLRLLEYNNSKLVATGILVLQQFCGINSIIFYGVSVLKSIFPDAAIIINCMISIVNAVITFASASLIDRLGRKPLLQTSVLFMGIACIMLGFGITTQNALCSVVGTFVYISFFAIGLGPIPFLLVGEVTQTNAKASAQSWGVTMNWVATFVVGFLFPVPKNSWIGAGVYYIFAAMCALTFFFVQKYVPETKGKNTYEEVWI